MEPPPLPPWRAGCKPRPPEGCWLPELLRLSGDPHFHAHIHTEHVHRENVPLGGTAELGTAASYLKVLSRPALERGHGGGSHSTDLDHGVQPQLRRLGGVPIFRIAGTGAHPRQEHRTSGGTSAPQHDSSFSHDLPVPSSVCLPTPVCSTRSPCAGSVRLNSLAPSCPTSIVETTRQTSPRVLLWQPGR